MAPSAFQTVWSQGSSRQILDQTPEETVRRVAMGVDQPRHQDHAGRVDHPSRVAGEIRRRPDRRDPATGDGKRAIPNHGIALIGRDDDGIGNNEIE